MPTIPGGPAENDAWREVFRGVIHPWTHDVFHHMNARWYAHYFDDAVFHLYAEFGISLQAMVDNYGVHTVTASTTTNYIKELTGGDLVRIEGGLKRIGGKSISFRLRMLHVDTGELHATYDIVEVLFDPETRSSTEIPAELRTKLAANPLIEAD